MESNLGPWHLGAKARIPKDFQGGKFRVADLTLARYISKGRRLGGKHPPSSRARARQVIY